MRVSAAADHFPWGRPEHEQTAAFDLERRRVATDGGTCEADFLIAAPGAGYDRDATPGLAERGNEFYSVDGAQRRRCYPCAVSHTDLARSPVGEEVAEPPEVEVIIEIPRGSFLKRGSTGHVDFISPLPCPFNYGSVPSHIGLEGDLLDAVVLGPRLSLGARRRVKAWGAVILTDRGMSDDKLVCSERPLDPSARRQVLRFFRFYAKCKGLLNFWRGRPGRNACEGWCEARQALARARPRDDTWHGPPIEF